MRLPSFSWLLSFLLPTLCVALSISRLALAEAPAESEADALFRAGKAQLAQKHYADACLLLDRSYRIAPATGCLLALAVCHERAGMLASAAREYAEAAQRSHEEGRRDRENVARDKVAELTQSLSLLTIGVEQDDRGVPPDPRKIVVKLDGAPIDPTQLGRELPVDGGTHRVEVYSAGVRSFIASVWVAGSHGAETVTIPVLAPPTRGAAVPESDRKRVAAPKSEARALARDVLHADRTQRPTAVAPASLSAWQWAGLGGVALGTAGLVAGLVYTLKAAHENRDSKRECMGNLCTIEGRDARISARNAGDHATIALSTGAVFVAAGVLAATLGKRAKKADVAPKRSLQAAPWASTHGAGALLEGHF